MTVLGWNRPLTAASVVVVLLAPVFAAPSGTSAQAQKVPVISLKVFVAVPEWQLDITWSAKDAYEDADWSARLEMTATARYILKQSDKKDAWGCWHTERVQSDNMAFSGFLVNKNDGSRTDYKSTAGPIMGDAAVFQVGVNTPGYQLDAGAAFPVKVTNPLIGSMDSLVSLLTTDIYRTPPVFCTGPLPSAGTTIHGSLVLPMEVPPFGSSLPKTRVGIQFVLQPFEPLAPLVPPKRK